jgi:hypothetical protein
MPDQATVKFREQRLGSQAVFLLPSLKLKEPASDGVSNETRLHAFLMDHFGGYTAQAGNIFGYWRSEGVADSYGEHREFSVAFTDDTKAGLLKSFLATLARDLHEECIYLRVGDETSLIYPQ